MSNDSLKNAERQLINDTLNGNTSSFQPLVEKYWGLVFSIIQKYVKNSETVADLSQEVFLIAYSRLQQYRPEFNFSPWLSKIAVNKALEFLRREKRSPVIDFDPDFTECHRFAPEQILKQRELFDECLEKLPAEMQIIFILRHGLEFSYDDIAHVLDLPVGTIKGSLFRVRNHLKRIFEQGKEAQQITDMVFSGKECHEE